MRIVIKNGTVITATETMPADVLVEGEEVVALAAPGSHAWEEGADRVRQVYFGPDAGLLETRLVRRDDLSADATPGPLIVEEYDSTVVVPPGWCAVLDARGNIVLERSDI